MALSEIIALLIATVTFVASPGPGIFALVSSSLTNRFSMNMVLSFGLITGDMIYLSLAMVGMAKIILIWGDFFFYVQFLGGLYLIYLGIRLGVSEPELIQNQESLTINKTSYIKQFTTAMMISLSNPKTILFYLGFLPAFINLENLSFQSAFLVALVIIFSAVLVCLVYISVIKNISKQAS